MCLILKGINLPEKNEGLYVYIFNGKAEVVHPLDACELVHINGEAIQLPRKHGKIGDLIALAAEIRKKDIWGGLNYERYIDDAPTILEAEEE